MLQHSAQHGTLAQASGTWQLSAVADLLGKANMGSIGDRGEVMFHIRTPPTTPAPISLTLVTAHEAAVSEDMLHYLARSMWNFKALRCVWKPT